MAAGGAQQRPLPRHVHDPDGHRVVAAQHDRGRVHHSELAFDDLVVAQPFVAHGAGMLLRVHGEHPVHPGRLDHQPRLELHRPERRGRIGREVRIAGAGGEDHHPPLLQVPDRAPAQEVLADLVDADRRHHPHVHPAAFQRVLQGEGIDHGCEHADVIAGGAVHPRLREALAPRKMLPPPMTIPS